MTGDPRGYYAELGLSSSASNEEIKAVYHALLKIYHPDINKDSAATDKSRRINDAYAVLGDKAKRATYDGEWRSPQPQPTASPPQPTPQSDQPEPTHCSVCNRITAQPRFLIFRKVISMILVTTTTPKFGIYCADCAAKVALRATALTAAFGWWGFPWGPILSIKEIIRNATGGERKPEVDEQLLWNNALAFLDKKNEIAMSLANQLQTANDPDIAAAAKHLVGLLSANGLPVTKLKSPWEFRARTTIVQLLMGAAVPGIVLLWLSAADTTYHAPVYYPQTYTPEYTTAYTPENAPTVTGSLQTPSPPLVDECALRPANGEVLTSGFTPAKYGHKLTIENGSTGDAIVKLRNAYSGALVASFFVRQGMSADLDGIGDGDYRVQFGYGEGMNADCASFINTRASEFNGIQRFQSRIEGNQIITQNLSFTLYPVAGGNVTENSISASAFDEY